MDNARVHKQDEIKKITSIFEFDYKFLSPYSFMLNPIENAFSKIKNGVRSCLITYSGATFSEIILSEVNNVNSNITRNITNCAADLAYEHQ